MCYNIAMVDYKPITEKDLEKGLFFLKHKLLLKRILLSLAFLILALIYLKFFFSLILYFRNTSFYSLAKIIDTNYNYAAEHQKRAPSELDISDAQYLSIGNKKYNLVAYIENPNEDWAVAEFEYRFIINNKPLNTQKAFLNPGQSRFLITLAYEAQKPIKKIEVEIGNYYWRRYNNDTKVVDWSLTDISFNPLSTDLPAQAFWTAQNMSLFDLRKVIFQIALFNGQRLIAINEIQASDYLSLDKKELDSIFWYSLPRVTETQVLPLFNWLNNSDYMYLETDVSSGSRLKL